MWTVRLVDILLLFVGLWGVGALAARLAGREARLWAMALAGLWYAGSNYGDVSQPDGWAAMLTALALGLAVSPRPAAWLRAVLAGLLMSWVALYKPILLVLAPLPLLALDLGAAQRSTRSWLTVTGAYCAAYGALVALVVLWVALRGAMPQMLETLLFFNKAVYWTSRPVGLAQMLALTGAYLLPLSPFVLLGIYGLTRTSPACRRVRAALILWALLGLALVLLQGRFYPYHWHLLYFAVATAAGVGVGVLLKDLVSQAWESSAGKPRVHPAIVYVVAFGVLLAPLQRILPSLGVWGKSALGLAPWSSYYATFGPSGQSGLSFLDQCAVADYLREHTPPGDSDFVWGFGPLILYLSGVPSASRFAYPLALISARYTSDRFWREYSSELMHSLTHRPPSLIVVGEGDATWAIPYESKDFLPRFPALQSFLRAGYVPDTSIGSFDIYRRRGPLR